MFDRQPGAVDYRTHFQQQQAEQQQAPKVEAAGSWDGVLSRRGFGMFTTLG